MASPKKLLQPVKQTRKKVTRSESPNPQSSAGNGTQTTPETPAKTSWAILLYIAADGNIANYGIESLKQLNRAVALAPDLQDQATVVVAAQFAIDAPGGQNIPRYIFDERSGGPLGNSFVENLEAPVNMTEQGALISFLKWALSQCKADKYALMLWGHGPEFLLQPPAADPQNDRADLYLSPEELREALEVCFPTVKPSIVGFDACSMSMFEMAYEIRKQADYMVASQEEVPDLSFPYTDLVALFRRSGGDVEALLKEGVNAYVDEYQDYVCTAITGMKPTTLSALRLSQCDVLKDALKDLACKLLAAKDDPGLPRLIIEARKSSQDYAGGLYVDMVDFAVNLSRLLAISRSGHVLAAHAGIHFGPPSMAATKQAQHPEIIDACEEIQSALVAEPRDVKNLKALVLANCAVSPRSNGVSLYFPYLCEQDEVVANQPLVKGGRGTLGGKEFSVALNQASAGLLMCARREMIVDTEGYYAALELAADTAWYRFITEQWSYILAQNVPEQLDTLYSAQQCAVNLSQVIANSKDPVIMVRRYAHPVTDTCLTAASNLKR